MLVTLLITTIIAGNVGLFESTHAKEAHVYSNMAEVRERLTADGTFEFSEKEFGSIVPGIVGVSGLKSQHHIIGSSGISNALNEKVFFVEPSCSGRMSSPCPYKQGVLVDPQRQIVKSLDDNRYLYVPLQNLQYTSVPDHNQGRFKVYFSEQLENNMQFFYYTRAVTWTTQHAVEVTSSPEMQDTQLNSFAVLKNDNDVAFNINRLRLIGTSLDLQPLRSQYKNAPMAMSGTMGGAAMYGAGGGGGMETTPIQSEQLSILSYDYPLVNINIPANSFIKAKLVDSNARIWRYSELKSWISEGFREVTFDKQLRVIIDKAVPSGSLVIREEGNTLASVTLAQTAPGKRQDINIGKEHTLMGSEETLISDTINHPLRKDASTKYVIRNFGKQTQNVEIELQSGTPSIAQLRIDSQTLRIAESSPKRILLSGQVPANLVNHTIKLEYQLIYPRPVKPITGSFDG